jgi:hypothetical protein
MSKRSKKTTPAPQEEAPAKQAPKPDPSYTGLCRDLREESEALDATPPPLDDLAPAQYAWIEAVASLLADEYSRRRDRATRYRDLLIEIKGLARSRDIAPEDRQKYRKEAKQLWQVYAMMEDAVGTAERWRIDLWDRVKVLLPEVATDLQVVRAEVGHFELDHLGDARKEWNRIEVAAAKERAFAGEPKCNLARQTWNAAECAAWRVRPEDIDMPIPAPPHDLQGQIAQFLSILDRWQSAVDYLAGGISELRPLTKRVISFTDNGKAIKCELKARAPALASAMERHGIDSKPLHTFVQDWGSDTEVRPLLSRLSAKALASHGPDGQQAAATSADHDSTLTPSDGAPMSNDTETRPANESNSPMPLADQIDRLIADADILVRIRPAVSCGGPDQYLVQKAQERETLRNKAVVAGKSIVVRLVEHGESARAILTLVNLLESKPSAQTYKDWPPLKTELQETVMRLKLKDDAARVEKPGQQRQGMGNDSGGGHVFVSYSHKDAKWLDKLKTMLHPVTVGGKLELWDDARIMTGDLWREEIRKALAGAKVGLLLVTPDFLESDFIAKNELPPLLDAAKKGGLTIFWIPVRHSMYEGTEIAKYLAAHDPARPLADLSRNKLDKALKEICKKLLDACKLNG